MLGTIWDGGIQSLDVPRASLDINASRLSLRSERIMKSFSSDIVNCRALATHKQIYRNQDPLESA